MDNTYTATTANLPDPYFPSMAPSAQRRPFRWLLELEADGTIRYSSLHPQEASMNDGGHTVGTNLFEIAELTGFRRDFVDFVKGPKNRQAFQLREADGPAEIVLTRSFDTTEAGLSCTVVLMEMRRN